jgi:hypothetical protein
VPNGNGISAVASNGFEKHMQTAIQVILVGITMWVGSAIITLRDSSIRLEEKYGQLQATVVDLKSEVAALRSILSASVERNIDTTHTLRNLESRVERLERGNALRYPPTKQ